MRERQTERCGIFCGIIFPRQVFSEKKKPIQLVYLLNNYHKRCRLVVMISYYPSHSPSSYKLSFMIYFLVSSSRSVCTRGHDFNFYSEVNLLCLLFRLFFNFFLSLPSLLVVSCFMFPHNKYYSLSPIQTLLLSYLVKGIYVNTTSEINFMCVPAVK